MKLQLSISNAKKKEEEFSQMESLLTSFEQENTTLKESKTTLKRSSSRLMKQMETLKSDLGKFNDEAVKASASPWEEDDWEGLSYMEIYNMMKDELVPAQQARLGRQCIKEMEDKVKEEQNLFIKAAAEIATLKDLNRKLDAKIIFLEVAPKEQTQEKEPKKMDKNLASRLIKTMTMKKTGSLNISSQDHKTPLKKLDAQKGPTPLKKTDAKTPTSSKKTAAKTPTPILKTAAMKAPKKTTDNAKENTATDKTADEASSRRRSSRISSKIDTPAPLLSTTLPALPQDPVLDDEEIKMSKTLNPEPTHITNPSLAADKYSVKDITPTRKRFISTVIQDEEEDAVEKRMKIKTSDTSSPARVNKIKMCRPRLNAIPSLASHSNPSPLSNQTNSPTKVKTPIKKPEEGVESSEDPTSSGVLTRAYNKNKSRSKEECKQQ